MSETTREALEAAVRAHSLDELGRELHTGMWFTMPDGRLVLNLAPMYPDGPDADS